MKQQDLRFYITAHFPRWISKSPLYFENIKHELPGFIEALETHFADEEINSFTMDWVLNMTPLNIRKKLKKMQGAINEMEFIVWENKVIQTIRDASDEEILYYALLMYLDLKDHPFAEIPKPQPQQTKKPLELADFLHNEQYRDKLPQIADKFKNSTGKEMATAISALLGMEVFAHGNRERKKLVKALNPNLNDTNIKLINNYLNPNNSSGKTLDDTEVQKIEEWLSSL